VLNNTPTDGRSQGSLTSPRARLWWNTSDRTWRDAAAGNTLANGFIIEPDDTLILVHRHDTPITWTNRPARYTPPTKRFTP
jgi:hypothetical protein